MTVGMVTSMATSPIIRKGLRMVASLYSRTECNNFFSIYSDSSLQDSSGGLTPILPMARSR